MKRILITGATGNIGKPILEHLNYYENLEVLAGVRNPQKDLFLKPVKKVYFDFEDITGSANALTQLDCLFLLRPPQISDVKKYFDPLIKVCQEKEVGHIVFLSVQGAEKSSIIPHNKIEKLIVASGIPYTFLRPGYFMQNLSGSLKKDIIEKDRIYIPAGKAKFNWIDTNDIGMAAARVIEAPEKHASGLHPHRR
ncbi:MAG: NmrA family NAD(P)-binding protein [Candidatus Cyclobacteriaceae bacterium M2_1C_046]